MSKTFTWVPLYRELADRLADWEGRQGELITLLEQVRSQGYVVTPLNDRDDQGNQFLIREIDPFTFFGTFNRGIRDDQRLAILKRLKEHFGAENELPSDFNGIPVLNNRQSWFVAYQYKRKPDDVRRLWRVFRLALGNNPLGNPEFLEAFDHAIDVWGTNYNLTMGLFWIRPDTFLNLDQVNRNYLGIRLPSSGLSADFYRETVKSVSEKGTPLVDLSFAAWTDEGKPAVVISSDNNYWLVGASWHGADPPDQCDRFLSEGVWENGWEDRYLDEVRSIREGDRIAIKSTFTQKKNLPFESNGKTFSCMRIKAIGTVVANRNDGRTVEVEWDPTFQPKEWYFMAHWKTIHKLDARTEEERRLIDFTFEGKRQDYAWFLGKYGNDNGEQGNPPGGGTTGGVDGPFGLEDVLKAGVFLEEPKLRQILDRLQSKKNLILQGPPGVGKTFIARKLAYALMEEKDDKRTEFVQFHQSYSYDDFVRGYRPLENEGGKFGLHDGAFFRFCQQAKDDPDRSYVFMIDEINRGNLSQIFGELLMLIEADKRGTDHSVPLVYSRKGEAPFYVPSNVYLIGLMNLADRSLALVDYALRRRFAFMTLKPQFASDLFRKWLIDRHMDGALVELIVVRMVALNQEISNDALLGENYQVGHSFFCPKGSNFTGLDRGWYNGIVETEILPLLKEYWFDNPKRAEEFRERLLAP